MRASTPRFDARPPLESAIRRLAPAMLADPVTAWMMSPIPSSMPVGRSTSCRPTFSRGQDVSRADVIVPHSYDRILTPLAAGLDIRFGHAVTAVAYEQGDGARVTVEGPRLRRPISSSAPVRFGLLQAGDIGFDPPLFFFFFCPPPAPSRRHRPYRHGQCHQAGVEVRAAVLGRSAPSISACPARRWGDGPRS